MTRSQIEAITDRLKEWGDTALQESLRTRPDRAQGEFYGRHAAFYEAAHFVASALGAECNAGRGG